MKKKLACFFGLVFILTGFNFKKPGTASDVTQTKSQSQELPWPSPVSNYIAPEPGEHPRLLFRKRDLAKIKENASTPEGRMIIARLRKQLNGSDGETMPISFNPLTGLQPDGSGEYVKNAPLGAYTYSHVAGYGMLYQLTGDKKYADLGRECMEKAFAGTRDRDNRYSFTFPCGMLRAGPVIGWYALGYDLCYDGWDPQYRIKVAQALANYNAGIEQKNARAKMNLESLVAGTMKPGSNHFGMQVGGAALAILAIMNDPGVDMNKIAPLLETNMHSMIRNMTEGFGDGGFFAEGDGTGSMSSHIVFIPGLQAWKVAGGKDFISPRSNAQWMALRWIFQSIPVEGSSPPDWYWPHRGAYPHNIWAREGVSGGGYFCEGFGGVTPEQRPALLWFYNHSPLKGTDISNDTPFDTPSPYPHHSVISLINWPFDIQEKNPKEVIPRCFRDTKWNFYAFRNRWQDENDIVITSLLKEAKGNYSAKADGTLKIAAFGRHQDWGKVEGNTKFWKPAADGSAILTLEDGTGLAIDFSGASGADGMIVMTGPGAGEGLTVEADGIRFSFLFLTAGNTPVLKVKGSKIVINKQTVSLKNGNIELGKMAKPWKSLVNLQN